MALGNPFNPAAGISNPFANFSKNVKPTKTQQVQSQIANPNMSVNPSATPAPNMSTVNGPAVGKIIGSTAPTPGAVSSPVSSLSPTMGALPMMTKTLPTIPSYDPTKIAGFNAPVIGNQFSSIPGSEKTQFTNFPEQVKQNIGQEIQQSNLQQTQPSKATNTDIFKSALDLSADISQNGEITPEDIKTYYPEFIGKEQAIADLNADIAKNGPISDKDLKELYPELTAAQVQDQTTMQGGIRGSLSKNGIDMGQAEWLNPAGKTFEEIDNQIQKIGVIDFTKGREAALDQRMQNMSPADIEKYQVEWENYKKNNPNLSKMFTKSVEGDNIVSQMWNLVSGNTKDTGEIEAFKNFVREREKGFVDQLVGVDTKGPRFANMMANVPGSLLKTISATARGMTNPIDTLVGLGKLVFTPEGRQLLIDRYGSLDAFAKSMEQDPIGVASDALLIIEGGAGAIKLGAKVAGASELAAKAGAVQSIANTAGNIGADLAINAGKQGLLNATKGTSAGAKTANLIAKTAIAATEPLKTAAKITGSTIDYLKKAPGEEIDTFDRLLAANNDLDAETIHQFRANAENMKALDEGTLTKESIKQDLMDIGDEADTSKGQAGQAYQKMYESDRKFAPKQILTDVQAGLRDKGAILDNNGNIVDFDRTNTNIAQTPAGELNLIKSEYNSLKNTLERKISDAAQLTVEEMHNLKKGLNNASYTEGVATKKSPLLRTLGEGVNTKLKTEVPGWENVDKLFTERAGKVREISDLIFNRKGEFKGTLKALLGEAQYKRLQELEKLSPGLIKKLEAIKAWDDYQKTRTTHKVGTYNKIKRGLQGASAGAVAGAWAGPVGAIIGSIIGGMVENEITDPALMKKILLKGIDASGLSQKIGEGVKLTPEEQQMLARVTENIAKDNADINTRKKNFKAKLEQSQKTKALPSPESVSESNIGTKQNPIKATGSIGEDPTAGLVKRQTVGMTDAPQKGDMTKYGEVTAVQHTGGGFPKYSVQVGGDKWMDVKEIGGVYKKPNIFSEKKPEVATPVKTTEPVKENIFNKTPEPTTSVNPWDEVQAKPEGSKYKFGDKRSWYADAVAEELGYKGMKEVTDPKLQRQIEEIVMMRDENKIFDATEKLRKEQSAPVAVAVAEKPQNVFKPKEEMTDKQFEDIQAKMETPEARKEYAQKQLPIEEKRLQDIKDGKLKGYSEEKLQKYVDKLRSDLIGDKKYTPEQSTKYKKQQLRKIDKEFIEGSINQEEYRAKREELRQDMKYISRGIDPKKLQSAKKTLVEGVVKGAEEELGIESKKPQAIEQKNPFVMMKTPTEPQTITVYKGMKQGGTKKFGMDYYALNEKDAAQYGNISKVNIKVNKLADFTQPSPDIAKILEEKSGFAKEFVERALKGEDSFNNPIYDMIEVPAVKQALKDAGYDAVKFKDYGNKNTRFARHDSIALLEKPVENKGLKPLEAKVSNPVVTMKDPLIQEAKKYKSAEELGLNVKDGGHILDKLLRKGPVDTLKVNSSLLGNKIGLDIRDLGKQTQGKLTSDYRLKKIQKGERPPILVGVENGKLKVIDGNHRASAYLQENIKDTPVILTQEAKQIREEANKSKQTKSNPFINNK